MTIDRRTAPRYEMDADITVSGVPGRTVNLSLQGVLFDTREPFVFGESVALLLPLTRAAQRARVACRGQVVRVDRNERCFRVAATYERTAFTVASLVVSDCPPASRS